MRNIRKHLTVVNRGASRTACAENNAVMQNVIDRYVDKMTVRGWTLDRVTNGDEFLKYGAYVYMYK